MIAIAKMREGEFGAGAKFDVWGEDVVFVENVFDFGVEFLFGLGHFGVGDDGFESTFW